MSKKKVVPKMKTYTIISDAVERGIAYGYRRAHKHVEHPTEEAFHEAIANAVMSELCEVVDFDK